MNMSMKTVVGKSVMQLIRKGARYLDTCEINLGYVNGGIVAYTLYPDRNGFNLGATTRAMEEFGNAQAIYQSVITNKAVGVDTAAKRIATESNIALWLSHIKTFGRFTDEQIREAKLGKKGAANAMAYPLCRHTLNLHKPCAIYWQYQYKEKTNTLSLIVNYRAQHLFALAHNLQNCAIGLLLACYDHKCNVGTLTILCNNHHIGEGEKSEDVCGKAMKWRATPCTREEMLKSVDSFFERLK